ncbi:MFS transporter [Sporosarcina soli]|uniref:MFS transporter n=1 Tax=Sporosarcina soli TaxID=334736 RepID=A0ABW0TP78_9BACL
MKTVNPIDVINKSRVHSFHILLVAWLFFVLMFDGYDVVIYGAVVSTLMEEWGMSDVMGGAIGSYTVAGTAVGAVIFGLMADKVGRKRVIIICTALFSLFTFLAGFATSAGIFTVCRIIAGLGLGGVMPNIIALVTEFAPQKRRTALVAFVFAGYSTGAVVAALTSRALLPTVGWKPTFWIAIIPIILLPLIMKSVPESVVYLIEKGKMDKVKGILTKVDPTISPADRIEMPKRTQSVVGSTFSQLFQEKRTFSTMMFWIAFFCSLLLVFAMNTWLPRLLMAAGFDLSSSLLFTAVMQLGAILGTVVLGPVMDRIGFKKVLVPLFFSGAIALALIGYSKNTAIVLGLITIIGAATIGVQNLSNTFVSQYYPTHMRATAIGSTMAFGRIGGILAPLIVGLLLSMNLQPQYNFGVIGIASLIGGVALLFVQEKHAIYREEKKVDEKHEKERSEAIPKIAEADANYTSRI